MAQNRTEAVEKEEMNSLMDEIEKTSEFDFLFFTTLRKTGRRVGELFGIEEKKIIGRVNRGSRIIYINNEPISVDRTIPKYKKTGNWIFGVKRKDINFEKGVMKVWVLKRREYIQDETILSPELVRLLSKHISKNKIREEDNVFRNQGISLRQLQNRLKKYAKKAGINKNIKIHTFRHYFITELKRKGWPDDKIRKLTGHKSTSMIGIYDHIVANDIREDIEEALKDL